MPRLPQSEQEREQVRQRILKAAQELFDSDGIEAVSMRAIGARVGLAASALYAYFPAKLDLIRALWRGALDDLQAKLCDLSRQEPDPIAVLPRLAKAYADFALEQPIRFRLLFMIDSDVLDADFQSIDETRIAYHLLRERSAEAIAQGRFRLNNPDLVAQTLWSAIHGVAALLITCRAFPFEDPKLLIDTMIETAMRGLIAGGHQGV